LNFGRIRSAFEGARDTFGEVMDVRAAVQAEFDTPEVNVSVNSLTSVDGSTLGVELVNPPFMTERGLDQEAKAREVAILTKSLLEAPEEWDVIEVRFSTQKDFGFTVSMTSDFSFRVDELPAVERGPRSEPTQDGPARDAPASASRSRAPASRAAASLSLVAA
ncbi:MAG: hypothetical protein OEQ13_10255, partial [Acidobacteriota bacterium]|nr:hypothetical protein [Acidobacteriota bacterium]